MNKKYLKIIPIIVVILLVIYNINYQVQNYKKLYNKSFSGIVIGNGQTQGRYRSDNYVGIEWDLDHSRSSIMVSPGFMSTYNVGDHVFFTCDDIVVDNCKVPNIMSDSIIVKFFNHILSSLIISVLSVLILFGLGFILIQIYKKDSEDEN